MWKKKKGMKNDLQGREQVWYQCRLELSDNNNKLNLSDKPGANAFSPPGHLLLL